MTDDMIQSLVSLNFSFLVTIINLLLSTFTLYQQSPAAAAASQMLKESKSITEIFARYQEVQIELGRVNCDNLKLNGYIREILEVILVLFSKQALEHNSN